jgi:hypothetical protein
MHSKLLWANNYLDTLIEGPGQIEAQKRYETRFGDRDHFLLREDLYSSDHLYANEKIYKISSASELIRLLQSIELEYAVRSAYAWQSYYGADWLNLDGHLTKTFANPWIHFQGIYSVQSAQCSNPSDYQKDLRQIQIYSADEVLYMRRSTPNGSGIDSIELGAYWMNASLNDYGQLASNKVYLTLEAGGSWTQRVLQDHHISRQTLETNPDQTFKMTIENTFEHHDVTKPDAKSSCVFTGTFQKR